MAEIRTRPTDADVAGFIAGIRHPTRRADAETLDALFRRVTGWEPRMWGPMIVGYGSYRYRYASGHAGEYLATGFAPLTSRLSLHIMPGYADMADLLDRLGKHRTGKACLYINKLADVDLDVLEAILRRALADLEKRWPVTAS
jgi:hypothetical protein